jgi:hypothetical protein
MVVYFRQEKHMSYFRTQAALRDLHAVKISLGGLDMIKHSSAARAGGQRGDQQAVQLAESILA